MMFILISTSIVPMEFNKIFFSSGNIRDVLDVILLCVKPFEN